MPTGLRERLAGGPATATSGFGTINAIPHDFYMPSGEEGSPRVHSLLPSRLTHIDPSVDDTDDEPFDLWTEYIDFQDPNDYIRIGSATVGLASPFVSRTMAA